MFYVKLKSDGSLDKYPYTLTDLRRDNPNTSFSQDIEQETAALFKVLPVQLTERPPEIHTINLERTAEKQGETWVEVWLQSPATPEQISERTALKSNDVRDMRNKLLAESDWTQIPDVPLDTEKKAEWAEYRQKLRDITLQLEFPWNVIFPDKPG